MMDAPFTAYHVSPNKSPRENAARRGVVLHHGALTSLSYLRRLAMGEKQVSATAICKDDDFERMVPEGWRPWSLSSAYWDSALRSVETANESTIGWTISDASHWSLARGVAYWASIDGFWPHRDGDPKTWTVIGHREVYTIHGGSYATACPGGMDLDLVTRRAQAILTGAATAALDETPIEEEEEMNKPFGIKLTVDTGTKYALVSADLKTMIPLWYTETANELAKVFGDFVEVQEADWAEFERVSA